MNQFKKEARYFVFKISKLTQDQQQRLYDFSMELGPYNSVENCVVVESDWPNYVETWETIQAVAENRYVSRDLLITQNNQLRAIEDAADEAYSAWFDRNLLLESASLSKLYNLVAAFDLKMKPDTLTQTNTDMTNRLADTLKLLFEDYKAFTNSGDAGNWKVQESDVGKLVIKVLDQYNQSVKAGE